VQHFCKRLWSAYTTGCTAVDGARLRSERDDERRLIAAASDCVRESSSALARRTPDHRRRRLSELARACFVPGPRRILVVRCELTLCSLLAFLCLRGWCSRRFPSDRRSLSTVSQGERGAGFGLPSLDADGGIARHVPGAV